MSYIGKYDADDAIYFDYIAHLDELHDGAKDIVFNFPVYVGAVNLARFLALHEIYQRVEDLAGHIADIGAYKGASFLYFAKLIKLFEPYNPTEAHGFEWFKGQAPGPKDDAAQAGKYKASKSRLERLIEYQGLGNIAKLFDLDLVNDLDIFFTQYPHYRYKILFIDCGIHQVMEEVLWHFWPRLTPGGVVIFDHYNDPVSPSESALADRFDCQMEQIPYSRSPTAFFMKK